MAQNKIELLKELRAELLTQGFDASKMNDAELEEWCKEAGIEIVAVNTEN